MANIVSDSMSMVRHGGGFEIGLDVSFISNEEEEIREFNAFLNGPSRCKHYIVNE